MEQEPEATEFGNALSVVQYMHCGKCIDEIPGGLEAPSVSPQDWADLSVGWTRWGFQVWCNRHKCNVVHVNFEGQKHPADVTVPKPVVHKPVLQLVQ